ncbi:MAG: hypothetical protein RTU30_03150 [Candidatus Thorarchaeota archaeon]
MSEDSGTGKVWAKRLGWLFLAMLVFIGTPFILSMVGDLTGVTAFRDIFGPLVFWNALSGPAFVIAFAVIVGLVAAIMFFILKSFETTEGAW